jgi:hypothetical protein
MTLGTRMLARRHLVEFFTVLSVNAITVVLSVVVLKGILASVVMMNVILVSVVMLNVAALTGPTLNFGRGHYLDQHSASTVFKNFLQT